MFALNTLIIYFNLVVMNAHESAKRSENTGQESQNTRKKEIVCVCVCVCERWRERRAAEAISGCSQTQLLALQGGCSALLAGTRSIDRCPQPLASPPRGPRSKTWKGFTGRINMHQVVAPPCDWVTMFSLPSLHFRGVGGELNRRTRPCVWN